MPRMLALNPQALETRRQLEQDLGLTEGRAATMRDIADTLMPAAGPTGFAAGMVEPPRQTTMGEALAPMLLGLAPLMLGKQSTAAQRRFKDIAMGVRSRLKGTAVATAGKPTRVFHGTSVAFEGFDPQRADPQGLYGPGFYFTEASDVAGGAGKQYSSNVTDLGYASVNPSGAELRVPREQAIAALRAIPDIDFKTPRLAKMLDDMSDTGIANTVHGMAISGEPIDADMLIRSTYEGAPNIRPAFLNIRKPFDMEGHIPIEDVKRLLTFSTGSEYESIDNMLAGYRRGKQLPASLKGDDVYGLLVARGFSGDKAAANELLQLMGYDGITHMGGAVTGGQPHRVWIAFSPEQVTPALQEGAPTHYRTRHRGSR